MSLPEDLEADARQETTENEKRLQGLEQCQSCYNWFPVAELDYYIENNKAYLMCNDCIGEDDD